MRNSEHGGRGIDLFRGGVRVGISPPTARDSAIKLVLWLSRNRVLSTAGFAREASVYPRWLTRRIRLCIHAALGQQDQVIVVAGAPSKYLASVQPIALGFSVDFCTHDRLFTPPIAALGVETWDGAKEIATVGRIAIGRLAEPSDAPNRDERRIVPPSRPNIACKWTKWCQGIALIDERPAPYEWIE